MVQTAAKKDPAPRPGHRSLTDLKRVHSPIADKGELKHARYPREYPVGSNCIPTASGDPKWKLLGWDILV